MGWCLRISVVWISIFFVGFFRVLILKLFSFATESEKKVFIDKD